LDRIRCNITNPEIVTEDSNMPFDWITWSIWFLGLVVLVVWTILPIREFKKLLADRKKKNS
jgi:hypothetical protein